MNEGLPKDILIYVLPLFLSPIDLTRLRGTCKQYYKWFKNDPVIQKWSKKFACRWQWNQTFNEASHEGYRDLVDLCISKGVKNWSNGLFAASRGGHRDLVDFFIVKGADNWSNGFYAASLGGHRDLVDFFIFKREISGSRINWNWGLYGASQGGHRDLVEFFKQKLSAN